MSSIKKPKITIESNLIPNEALAELLDFKAKGTLQEYGEQKIIFEGEKKKLNVGDIILYKSPNALFYCKIKLVMVTINIFTNKKRQIVDYTYEDIIKVEGGK